MAEVSTGPAGRRTKASAGVAVVLVALAAALTEMRGTRAADEAADFYRGKTISVIVGFGAGGGYDLYARLLAHYVGNHIPGQPNVVVQNMEGAGSVRASNYVYSVAPKDGTVIAAVNQNMPMYQMLGGAGAQFNAAEINWLGSMAASNGTLYTWAQSGIRTLEDAKTRDVLLGGAGTTSDSYIYPTLLNGLLGTRFKVINGYAGTKEIHLALERGEVMGRGGNTWASLLSSNQDWVDQKKINLLVQIGFKPEPEIAQVPLLIDLVKRGPEQQIATVVTLPTALGYTHFGNIKSALSLGSRANTASRCWSGSRLTNPVNRPFNANASSRSGTGPGSWNSSSARIRSGRTSRVN